MGTSVPARELRNKYGQLIERVRHGERITVVADGVPVIDLVPHAPDSAPPRFRASDSHPVWAPLSRQAAEEWASDLRRLADAADQSVRDPWVRG